jgi:hypothetical protein
LCAITPWIAGFLLVNAMAMAYHSVNPFNVVGRFYRLVHAGFLRTPVHAETLLEKSVIVKDVTSTALNGNFLVYASRVLTEWIPTDA